MARRTFAAGGLAALGVGTALAASTAATAPARRAPAPALTRFASCDAFLAHVRRHASELSAASPGLAPRAVAPGDAGAPAEGIDFSGTNLQEAGVDEPDLVETDGRTIFSVTDGGLRATDITGARPRVLPGIDLRDVHATGLMLAGDRLLVLGDAGGGVPVPVDVVGSPAPGAAVASDVARVVPWRPSTVLVQLDVSDPARPRTLARMRVDGSLVAARRTGTTVRVVIASSPTRIPLVAPSSGAPAAVRAARAADRRIVRRAGAGAWLPRLTIHRAGGRTVRRSAVGCRAVGRPTDYAGIGTIDILTLGVRDPLTVLDSDAVMGDGELAYASADRLYVATSRWAEPVDGPAPPSRGTTLVHAFDTSGASRTTYVGSGRLPGYLPSPYAMSEQDGLLRAATTQEPPWWRTPSGGERSQSFVTVLAERGATLEEVGRLGGLGRGERIQSARFIGDRAYVVTFRRVDPLFVIDLSDPAHPAARGELTMPGFSSYLHPVDDGTLIGVGQAADSGGVTSGTQVSLFDVSDPDHPRRLAQRTLDTDWSEAESEPHAFLWWPATSLLVLPAQSYGAGGRPAFLGAVGLHVTRPEGVTPIARVRHPDRDGTWAPVRRALVAGGALYTVSDTGVMASDLATLAPRGWASFR